MPPKKQSIPSDADITSDTPNKYSTQDAFDQQLGSSSSATRKRQVGGGSGITRTGQACDRCRSRKIRCDDTEGGCLPCRQNNTECKTTDRISGRPTIRGHTEAVERDNYVLNQRVQELEEQIRQLGFQPKTNPPFGADPSAYAQGWSQLHNSQSWNQSPPSHQGGIPASQDAEPAELSEPRMRTEGVALPKFRPGCTGDNYLGVSTDNNLLSPIKGTSLSLFGTQINLKDFVERNDDDTESPMSYRGLLEEFIQPDPTAAKRSMELLPPNLDDIIQLVHYYFLTINTWMPLLHKPDFMRILEGVYYRNYKPTPAENVMIHMVLANMKYHMATKGNQGDKVYKESFQHYRLSLNFISDLITSRTVADLQAMAMITIHIRNFPEPGAAWMMSNWSLSVGFEVGLHRSASAWGDESKLNPIEVEMRKRVFWTLLLINVAVGLKLGRPMPLRTADYDIELPSPLVDVSKESGDPYDRYSFYATNAIFKMVELLIETYNCVYSIRLTTKYEESVQAMEKKLEKWKNDLPPEISESSLLDPNVDTRFRVFALWMQFMETECQLLLHHPALCKSSSPEFIERSLEICTLAASTFIHAISQLAELQSLDTTWYNAVTYIAAVFTLLFSAQQRSNKISMDELMKIKADIDRGLGVIAHVGTALGSGDRLPNAIRAIAERNLRDITNIVSERTQPVAVGIKQSPRSPGHKKIKTESQKPQKPPKQQSSSQNQSRRGSHVVEAAHTTGYGPITDQTIHPSQSSYVSANQVGYGHTESDTSNAYSFQQYSTDGTYHQMTGQGMSQQHSQGPPQSNFTFNAQLQHQPAFHSQQAWNDWMASSSKDVMTQDYVPATTLMTMSSGRDASQVPQTHVSQSMTYMGTQINDNMQNFEPQTSTHATHAQSWPMVAYDVSPYRSN